MCTSLRRRRRSSREERHTDTIAFCTVFTFFFSFLKSKSFDAFFSRAFIRYDDVDLISENLNYIFLSPTYCSDQNICECLMIYRKRLPSEKYGIFNSQGSRLNAAKASRCVVIEFSDVAFHIANGV